MCICISEPETGTPSTVMQVVKPRFAKSVLQARRKRASAAQQQLWDEEESRHVWQTRFYDFNVWSRMKCIETLRYMHENSVKRGLVLEAGQWAWSYSQGLDVGGRYRPGASLTEQTGSMPDTLVERSRHVEAEHALESEQCDGREATVCL